jgi:putrescine aminotransferase
MPDSDHFKRDARVTRFSSPGESRLWHGLADMSTVKRSKRVIERGDGVYLWDESGHQVLDLPGSLWYCNVGHGRAEIADAAAAQMKRIAAYSNFQQYATRPALDLAERLADLAPVEEGRVWLGSGGGDAVEFTSKLARRHWTAVGRPSKRILVSRDRSYHGLHGFGTSIGGLEPNVAGYGELMPDVLRVPHDDWRMLEELVVEVGADRIAAFFCEPIIGTGGVWLPAEDYLVNVQRICRENEIIFVADEVITGFGRSGELFASQRFGIQPDVLMFAKGVTSGYLPLGGAIVSGWVAAPFWDDDSEVTFRHGLTYQGHATVAAAAHATLDILEREELVPRVRALEGHLAVGLRSLESHPAVLEVRTGIGLLGAVQLHGPELFEAVADGCWSRGVVGRAIAFGDTLHVCPPFVIEESEIDRVVEVVSAALDDAMERDGGAALSQTSPQRRSPRPRPRPVRPASRF